MQTGHGSAVGLPENVKFSRMGFYADNIHYFLYIYIDEGNLNKYTNQYNYNNDKNVIFSIKSIHLFIPKTYVIDTTFSHLSTYIYTHLQECC